MSVSSGHKPIFIWNFGVLTKRKILQSFKQEKINQLQRRKGHTLLLDFSSVTLNARMWVRGEKTETLYITIQIIILMWRHKKEIHQTDSESTLPTWSIKQSPCFRQWQPNYEQNLVSDIKTIIGYHIVESFKRYLNQIAFIRNNLKCMWGWGA